MPGSKKVAQNRALAANRAAGVGDENGRLPSRVKAETVVVNCTQCQTQLRMSKTNADAKIHVESKHPNVAFAVCFPGQFDPTVAAAPAAAATSSSSTAAPAAAPKPKAKVDDLSFLDAALDPKAAAKKK